MGSAQVLVVQHSESLTTKISAVVSECSLDASPVFSVQAGLNYLQSQTMDIAVIDTHMEKDGGQDLLRHIESNYRSTKSIVVTDSPSLHGAVEAIKHGALSYLSPAQLSENLPLVIQDALKFLHNRSLEEAEINSVDKGNIELIGQSAGFRNVIHKARKAAQINENILISGESGTGKDLLARFIHYQSDHSDGPFIPVNCGAIPNELLESELFGHVEGAYTGASQTRDGFFQAADGGTIFLDEISETTPSMQAKLLRAIEDQEIWKIGNRRPDTVNVQIIAATNKDLKALIEQNKFREDLYYRLNIIPLKLPPLKSRNNDVLLLSDHFVKKYAGKQNKQAPRFSQSVLQLFHDYDWPGNIRELENVIKRLVAFTETDTVQVSDLPESMKFRINTTQDEASTLADAEKLHIRRTCERTGWNLSKTARILNISRCTLYNKLDKYDINSPPSSSPKSSSN